MGNDVDKAIVIECGIFKRLCHCMEIFEIMWLWLIQLDRIVPNHSNYSHQKPLNVVIWPELDILDIIRLLSSLSFSAFQTPTLFWQIQKKKTNKKILLEIAFFPFPLFKNWLCIHCCVLRISRKKKKSTQTLKKKPKTLQHTTHAGLTGIYMQVQNAVMTRVWCFHWWFNEM